MKINEIILPKIHEDIDGYTHYLSLVYLLETSMGGTPDLDENDISYISSIPSDTPTVGKKFSYAMSILHHDGRVTLFGSASPVVLTKITNDNGVQVYTFANGKTYPSEEYRKLSYCKTHLFNSNASMNNFLSAIGLKFRTIGDLNEAKRLAEGGWASTLTQGTVITPAVVQQCMKILTAQFIPSLNKFLETKGLAPTEISRPGGSATYYERDLVQQPDKEYGDVDVQFHIPRIEGTTNNINADTYKKAIKEFCDSNPNFSSDNGVNVILQLGDKYVQVDLIMSYYENKEWTTALAPEWNLKGVLANSMYSAFGEVLNLSIGGGHGVQAKFQNGTLVPFRTVKDVELKTVTNNPKTWAIDIVKFFGGKTISPRLKQYPGVVGGEVRVSDMINSIRGVLESLDKPELAAKVKEIYLTKINAAINSSKYDKAETPHAIEKAKHTKEMLAQKSAEIAALFDR